MTDKIDDIYAVLEQLKEKVDKQENTLEEILVLLKKHIEVPHLATITTTPLGSPFG